MDFLIAAAHWLGSAVCHQWPDHSYSIAGVQLPLCARCTGMYLGGLLTLAFHSWRNPHAAGYPPVAVLVALVLFFLAWAGDGVNSFLSTLSIASLYPPQNVLRLATGALMGITLGTLLALLLSSLAWPGAGTGRLLGRNRDFLALLALQAGLVVAVNSQANWLLLPVMLLSLLAILGLNGGLMTVFVLSFRSRPVASWRQLLAPAALGLAIALTYLDALAFGRFLFGLWLGSPI